MPQYILVLNAGSSSVKFSVFEAGALAQRWRGQIEGLGAAPRFEIWQGGEPVPAPPFSVMSGEAPHKSAFAALFGWLFGVIDRDSLIAAGHRVVHGGGVFTEPVAIGIEKLSRIDGFSPLAPLHQPHNVAGIRAVSDLAPHLLQVACFDTAFHRTIPAHAHTLALPKHLREAGIRRYGFHGLSFENVARTVSGHSRIVAAHLGNGASLCAIRDGASIDTTMSFTALDGLVMGTRAGALDPGVLLHLMRAHGMGATDLEALLYRQSGLLGLSGLASDMRALLESPTPEAALAIECFIHRLAKEIGAMAASLQGLDALVFTAGIGERSAEIRALVCGRLGWLGVKLDARANAAHERRISAPDSPVAVLIVPADEERIIAQYTMRMASGGSA